MNMYHQFIIPNYFLGTHVYNFAIIWSKIKLVWFYLRIIAELFNIAFLFNHYKRIN